MRRTQVDISEQPVRNLFSNPGAENAGSGIAVRINLGLNPNFTATSGTTTVRTNLCLNPNIETGTTGILVAAGTGGTATLTRETTGGYVGTSFARATWTVGTSAISGNFENNPNSAFALNAKAALSVYVRVNSPQRLQIVATGTAVTPADAGGNPAVDVPANVWTRLTFLGTVTTAGNINMRIIPVSGGFGRAWVAGDTLDTDGWLLEASGFTGDYFDGSTAAANGLSHAWTGTANSSTSNETALSVSYWAARWFGSTGGTGSYFQHNDGTSTGPYFRKLWKTANTGSSQDVGINPATRITVTAGASYTASVMARTSEAGQHMTVYIQWYDSTGTMMASVAKTDGGTMAANTWTRFSNTATAPTGATTADVVMGPYAAAIAMPAGATLDFDQFLFEAASVANPYFDGNTPAAGDFTYAWSGTVDASTSLMRGTGLTIFGSGSNSASIQSTDWSASGTKSLRITPNNHSTTQDTFAYISMANLPKGTYTILATLRMTAAQTNFDASRARRIMAYHSNTVSSSPQAANAPGIYPLRLTFTITDSTVYQSFRLYHGGSNGNPDVWWDNIMFVQGDYQGDFINPDQNVLAKWDGTAHNSTSVGYPPTLTEIAGKPTLDLSAVGTLGPTTVDGFAARTIYLVHEVTDISLASWQVPLVYGNQSTDGFTVQTNSAGTAQLVPRADFVSGGGSTNATTGISARTAGRVHVVAFAFNQGLTQMNACANGGADVNRVFTPGTVGWTVHKLAFINPGNGLRPLRGMVYWGEHDRATRVAISRYLGNKYGATVA